VKSIRGELTAAEREAMVRQLKVKARAGTLSKLEKRELIRAAVDRDAHDSFANLAERKKQEKLDAAARRTRQAHEEDERRADPVGEFIRASEAGAHELSAEQL